jgi:hypothetical protein
MKISVCIPTFNQGLYIEKAIRSVSEQTQQPHEIIVSDDLSTDGTTDILKQLELEIPTLNVIYQPENLGICRNTDACLRSASGEIIVRLDSDDYLHPDYIYKLSQLLIKYPDAGFIHAAVQEVDKNGVFLNERKLFRKEGFQSGDEALIGALKGYRVAANIIMFRKTALEKVNYLSGRPNFGEDYHLTTAISDAGFGNIYSDEILSFYRVWIDSGKVRQKRKLDEIIGIRKVFEEVIEPAYKKRGWSLELVAKKREAFACNLADCLSWSVYNSEEKKELLFELRKLCTSLKTHFFISIYSSRIGGIFESIIIMKNTTKHWAKSIIVRLKMV